MHHHKHHTSGRRDYKDISEGEAESVKGKEESVGGGSCGWGRVGGPVSVLFQNSSGSPPGPVKSPHIFIKDENLLSIWKDRPRTLKQLLN